MSESVRMSGLGRVNGILKIVKINRDAGIEHVLISSLMNRVVQRTEAINGMLKIYSPSWGFSLIDNSDVTQDHLLEDGVNLNDEGLDMLANNYIEAINKITS